MSRPREVLNAFGRAHFGAWTALDRLRAARHREWPPYVFAPLDIAGLAIVEALHETRRPLPHPDAAAARTRRRRRRPAPPPPPPKRPAVATGAAAAAAGR